MLVTPTYVSSHLPAALTSLAAVVTDSFALVMEARSGVPAKSAFAVANLLLLSTDELADLLHTTTKTLRTYRDANKRLAPAASEQVLKLLALARQGGEVFGEPTAFRRWLGKPAFGLDNQPPLALLQTSGGIDLVAEEVSRIAYGDFA
ncbi:antitoxin Xre/MbcA/ParS toxin-binding domain-containing protein [Hymenobacter psoromatis]|uniref:type II RES/Xre toxin-antitoxin system antitoxin n=1 Tax=Hymenobacter psoromatis TaxID=1484116 RepID=UPI001CBE3BBF|nr:antitoxin Xre/MbcA/ParS toxin-binding domain-containing protein [Hymenobacter psoromatis]